MLGFNFVLDSKIEEIVNDPSLSQDMVRDFKKLMHFGVIFFQVLIVAVALLAGQPGKPPPKSNRAAITSSRTTSSRTRSVAFSVVNEKEQASDFHCRLRLYNPDFTWKSFPLIGKAEAVVLAEYETDLWLEPQQEHTEEINLFIDYLPAEEATESDINCR